MSSKRKSKAKSEGGFKLPVINDVRMSRRTFMKASVATAAVAGTVSVLSSRPGLTPQALQTASAATAQGTMVPANTSITLLINGKSYTVPVQPRDTLLYAIRDVIGLTGSKNACDRAECGACTVNIDGKNIYSCTMLALRAGGGQKITTVEGLANGTTLHPLQVAYVKYDAMQCSYCIPGQLMSAYTFLTNFNYSNNTQPTRDQIRAAMAGNICRCGTYAHQMQAIQEAALVMGGQQAAVVPLPVA
jgi:xanthine dehydrogenase YagT iron-sulfur-binding subunit